MDRIYQFPKIDLKKLAVMLTFVMKGVHYDGLVLPLDRPCKCHQRNIYYDIMHAMKTGLCRLMK